MSHIDNIFIQVRGLLQRRDIKLWEEPYYSDGVGSIEAEMDRLAAEIGQELSIEISHCKCVLSELQDNALRKLAARREYTETGLATFRVRRIDKRGGTTNMLDVKCDLNATGDVLMTAIAAKLELENALHVKCISAGRIVAAKVTLAAQGLKNNQQLIVIVGDATNQNNEALYDRINKIKADVEAVVDSQRQLVEMEDQNGDPVFLPPDENRALLMGMGYCEKARAAMHRLDYDEALLLLLEADERFSLCNSKFLETVDNYALLNLDIVWCYLCLKNVSQLPDAERRLQAAERNFKRSYGENFSRLYALKGKKCPERALILRLQLLQGVVFFHQNRRDEAYERFELAEAALKELKVDEEQLLLLVEMGFDMSEARLALRSCDNNVERSVQFIQERKQKIKDARAESRAERELNRRISNTALEDNDWVNPRSICTLAEMGFERALVVAALRRTKNDVPRALDLLQNESVELAASLPVGNTADAQLMILLQQLGFDNNTAQAALESTDNNIERSIEYLLKGMEGEEELVRIVERMGELASTAIDGPSTSQSMNREALHSLIEIVQQKARDEIKSYKAYERFHKDITHGDQDYLDLPLVQEEQLLAEYRNLLEQ